MTKKIAFALIGTALALGAPSAYAASLPACGYDACHSEGGYGGDVEGNGGAYAQGVAAGSPGVLSGNVVQVPVHVPVNVCGNSVSVIGALNPAFGNTCLNA